MSLVRAAGVLTRHRQGVNPLLQMRFASGHAHEEHHDGEVQDSTVYPREDFFNPFWRRFVLFSLGVVGFYKFAPAPGEDALPTRFIQQFSTPREVWDKINFRHLMQSVEASDDALLVADAKRAPVHRYRYTLRFEQVSPHLHTVGPQVDLSDLVVKTA